MEARPIRVFLADDHPIVLDGVARFLASTARVEVVGSAADVQGLEEGLRATGVDVVVLDLDMPGMDGVGGFQRLRGEFDRVRWVIFTMKREEREAAGYLRLGASAFLNKSRPPDELVGAIEMAHRGGRYLTDRVLLDDLASGAPLPHTTFSERGLDCGGCSYRERCGGSGEENICGCEPPVLAICGRGVDGIRCAIENGVGTFSGSYLALGRFVDADHWNNLQYFSTLRFPDINGDGFADVCARGADGLYCALGMGTGHFNDYYKAFDSLWDANGWDDPSNYGTIQFADINNDGADDVCARWDNGWGCAIADGDGYFNGNSNWALDALSTGYPNYTETHDAWATIQMPDIDGDGWPDICLRRSNGGSPQGLACARNSGAGWYDFGLKKAGSTDPYFGIFGTTGLNEPDVWLENAYNWGTIQFPDLNGDRARDVCGVDQTGGEGIRCTLSNGAGELYDYSMWSSFFKPSEGWAGDDNWSTIHFPDVNGDGLADVCGRGNQALRCALSDGTRFGSATVWQSELGNGGHDEYSIHSIPSRWGTLRYQDIDGDGFDDVCARAEQGIVCARSNGVDGMGDLYLATDAFRDDDPNTDWSTGQQYWGTIQFVEIVKGDCRSPSGGLPWGTSAKEPRYSP